MSAVQAPDGFACWSVWAEIADQAPTFLVDNVIHGNATMVVGASFVGKTTLVASLASAIARGDSKFADFFTIRSNGHVMVVATDPGEAARWGVRMRTTGVDRGAVRVAQWEPVLWERRVAAIIESKPAMVVFDNVLGALDGNVKDNDSASKLLNSLTRIANAGIAVLVIHHTSKPFQGFSSKEPMGTRVFTAWPRLVVAVEETADNQLLLSIRSNDQASMAITLDVSREEGCLPTYSAVEATNRTTKRRRKVETQEARILLGRKILDDPTLANQSQGDIAARLETNKAAVQRALAAVGATRTQGVWSAG